jgi:16S rRNA (uracil1498-N3)-methyltransferase
MRLHRAFVTTISASVFIKGREFEHLRVLRLRVGDGLIVFDGTGLEADARIVEIDEISVQLEVDAPRKVNLEPPQAITLGIALLKGDKLADVVRACTELGVGTIQLLVTEFSDAKEIGSQKLQRLRRIALEASKQCKRSVVPNILEPVKLLQYVPENALMAHPGSSVLPRVAVRWNGPVTLFTGPEGGFSDQEIAWLEQHHVTRVGLGPRILRAETAPMALLAAITSAENQ